MAAPLYIYTYLYIYIYIYIYNQASVTRCPHWLPYPLPQVAAYLVAHGGAAANAEASTIARRRSAVQVSTPRQRYARRMAQPTQRTTNYTARSNIEPVQIFLHANGQRAPRSDGACDVGRGAGSHTPSTAAEAFSHTMPHTPPLLPRQAQRLSQRLCERTSALYERV